MAAEDELPISFSRFADTLLNTADEVFTHLLRLTYGNRNMKPSEWRDVLERTKNAKI